MYKTTKNYQENKDKLIESIIFVGLFIFSFFIFGGNIL